MESTATAGDPAARTDGPGPRVLVESVPDTASCNIAQHVREFADWTPTDATIDGHSIARREGPGPQTYLARIDDWHVHRESLGEQLAAALGFPLEAILVLSRHRAASGHPSLTAHPIGNPGPSADAGGRPRTATPCHPSMLRAAYLGLRREAEASELSHSVSLEATHHGPETAVPVTFIEIGSDETHYEVPEAGAVVARAALSAIDAPTRPIGRTILGIGGGHYAPRFGALMEETPAAVGHMLASYHWTDGPGVPRSILADFLAASGDPGTPRAEAVYFDRKSVRSEPRRAILADLEALDVPLVRTADLTD